MGKFWKQKPHRRLTTSSKTLRPSHSTLSSMNFFMLSSENESFSFFLCYNFIFKFSSEIRGECKDDIKWFPWQFHNFLDFKFEQKFLKFYQGKFRKCYEVHDFEAFASYLCFIDMKASKVMKIVAIASEPCWQIMNRKINNEFIYSPCTFVQ